MIKFYWLPFFLVLFFTTNALAANEQVNISYAWNSGNTNYFRAYNGGGGNATEAYADTLISAPGCFHSLYIKTTVAPDNGGGTEAYQWILRKNGADTSLTCTYTDTETTCEDAANSACYSAGDSIAFKRVTTGSPASGGTTITILFTPDINGETNYGTQGALSGNLPTSGTAYATALTSTANSTTRAQVTAVMPISGTLKDLYISLPFAPGAGDSWIFTIQKNQTDTALTVTISDTATTGSNTADSVSFAAGDNIVLAITATGTPVAFGEAATGMTFVPDENGYSILALMNYDDLNATTTEYAHLNTNGAWTQFETNVSMWTNAFVARTMYVSLLADPDNGAGTQSYTFTLRNNGADTALSVALSDGETSDSLTLGTVGLDLKSTLWLKVVPANTPTVTKSLVSVGAYRTPARRD